MYTTNTTTSNIYYTAPTYTYAWTSSSPTFTTDCTGTITGSIYDWQSDALAKIRERDEQRAREMSDAFEEVYA